MKNDLFSGLTDEQIAKVKKCKTQEELLALAKEEGVELNSEQLEAISGGNLICSVTETHKYKCPKCNSKNILIHGTSLGQCGDCGFQFWL